MTLLDEMAEALKCWQRDYPIRPGDTLYSGSVKAITAEVLAKYEAAKEKE